MSRLLASLTVFISSACIMVIELVAGRMVAPALGVSLFTWTTVIGVVLGGIGLGNFLGGRIADRYPSRHALVVLLLLGALVSLSIVYTIEAVSLFFVLPLAWPIVLRFLLVIGLVFFLPTTVLGTITPVVIKLSLHDLARAGVTVGTLYALSLAGSIAGTFATGFYLIAAFGTRTLVVIVAGVLAALALLIAARGLRRREAALAGLCLAMLATSASGSPRPRNAIRAKSCAARSASSRRRKARSRRWNPRSRAW